MVDPTDAEMLTAIRNAKLAIIQGRVSSYSVGGGVSFSKLSLKELNDLEIDYMARVAAATSYGGLSLGEIGVPE